MKSFVRFVVFTGANDDDSREPFDEDDARLGVCTVSGRSEPGSGN
jgi:hypothetical protein